MHSSLLRRGLAVAALLVVSPFVSAASKPATNPRVDHLIDALFTPPQFDLGKLSPDGSHFAFLHQDKALWVLDSYEFKTGKFYRIQSEFDNRIMDRWDIFNFYWIGPDQVVFQTYWGFYQVTENLKNSRKLTAPANIWLNMAASLPNNPDWAYLYDTELYGHLWRMNKKAGTISEFDKSPGKVIGWELDQTGTPRIATLAENDGGWSHLIRDGLGQPWRPLKLPRKSTPVMFDQPGRNLLITHPDAAGRAQLQQFDLQAQQLSGEAIIDPEYDVSPVVIPDCKTGVPVGLAYEGERTKFLWLNPQYGQLHAALQKVNPGCDVHLLGLLAGGEMLFATGSDVLPLVLYRVNVKTLEIKPIAVSQPKALDDPWAPMKPITFAARDGHALHGYLTLPASARPGKKVPLIALPHGGPRLRDSWGFNSEVQFLASLGYAVLQVNYRGSTGYGGEHELKNTIAVCEKSVDDVVDGIRWAVAQGLADPARIAAYGGSYGGYISLGIATRYPELLTVAVGFAGVYDWEVQLKEDKRYKKNAGEYFRWHADYYIDPKIHGDLYQAFSPARAADKVRCPVLLLHGGSDRVVDIGQTSRMSRALRDAGKSVEVIKDAEWVHGWTDFEQLQNYYRSLAAFLLKNVPPDPQ